MSYIWTIIIGAIVGCVAKFIMPGDNEPKGFIMTAILGIVGSLLAGVIASNFGILGTTGLWGFISNIIGAVIVLIAYGVITKPKAG
jgi:uncharacterized membrane protein YeaQ/YmgE (transglycosylase-associated protein family)